MSSNLNSFIDSSKLYVKAHVSQLRGTHVISVTPDLAQYWLDNLNTGNRPLGKALVRRCLRSMNAGRWALNGETIKFSTEAHLLDGQHRLKAVVLHGKPVLFEVRFGLPPEVFDTLNTGGIRTGGHVLYIDGVLHYSNVASAINLILMVQAGVYYRAGGYSRPANWEIRDWYYDHPEIYDMVLLGMKWYKISMHMLPASHFAAWNYLFSQVDKSAAEKFLHKLATGENLTSSSVIYLLRHKLMESKFNPQKQLNPKVEKALIIKAWNYYRSGRSVKLLKFAPEKEKPPVIK